MGPLFWYEKQPPPRGPPTVVLQMPGNSLRKRVHFLSLWQTHANFQFNDGFIPALIPKFYLEQPSGVKPNSPIFTVRRPQSEHLRRWQPCQGDPLVGSPRPLLAEGGQPPMVLQYLDDLWGRWIGVFKQQVYCLASNWQRYVWRWQMLKEFASIVRARAARGCPPLTEAAATTMQSNHGHDALQLNVVLGRAKLIRIGVR